MPRFRRELAADAGKMRAFARAQVEQAEGGPAAASLHDPLRKLVQRIVQSVLEHRLAGMEQMLVLLHVRRVRWKPLVFIIALIGRLESRCK